uniref:Uncharacterized protein n=1 Tax=Podarcis muralis TaxID=64176 RepID=A0A670JA59_PODMU
VGEAEVEDLVAVLRQRLNFHAGDGVGQPLELAIPGRHTWVSWDVPGYWIVSVEKVLPEHFVLRHGMPLPAYEPLFRVAGVLLSSHSAVLISNLRRPTAHRAQKLLALMKFTVAKCT